MNRCYLPAGSTSTMPFPVVVDPKRAGWQETSLWVVELPSAKDLEWRCDDNEILVVPLAGSATVSSDNQEFTLTGRASVFSGPTDFAYIGRDSTFHVSSASGVRVALCGARAQPPTGPLRRRRRRRGRAPGSRQLQPRGAQLRRRRRLRCRLAHRVRGPHPGGNWSSYPAAQARRGP